MGSALFDNRIIEVYVVFFSIRYRYRDSVLKKPKLHLTHIEVCCNCLLCCNQSCNCIGMDSVTSALRYVTSASRYQSRPWMSDSTKLAEAVQIDL